MTEPAPRPARDQVDDLRNTGVTVRQAFDIAGVRWPGVRNPTWEDLEHVIRMVTHMETRPR